MSTNAMPAGDVVLDNVWVNPDYEITTTPAVSNNWMWVDPYYPWPRRETVTIKTEPSKIRLTFSEAEKLREVAKKDKEVARILQKFAPHVDLTMDFG
jgi:hypothetical protein